MKFQSLREWIRLNEGGAAIPSSRRITFEEGQKVYEWVKENIIPEFNVTENDIETIGSFGKKKRGENYGDLDIVIEAKILAENNNLEQDPRILLDFLEEKLLIISIKNHMLVVQNILQ